MKKLFAILVVLAMALVATVATGEGSDRKEIFSGNYDGSQSFEPGGYVLVGDENTIARVRVFFSSEGYMLYTGWPDDPSNAQYLLADISITPDGVSSGHVAFDEYTFMVVEIEQGHLYIMDD